MKKKVKAFTIVDKYGALTQQWHSAKSVFLYKIYTTAETARNQIRKISPELDVWIVPCEITYTLPSSKKKTK